MYAVFTSGGKQYKATVGDYVDVEKLNAVAGDKVNFDVILYVADDGAIQAGKPVLSNVTCTAEVVKQDKADKIIVFKYKPKKNERKKQGHRQPYTRVKILSIEKA